MNTKNDIFEREDRLYKFYINDLDRGESSDNYIKDLFKLQLFDLDKSAELDLVRLYEIVGFDKFFEIIAAFGGKTIKIPKDDRIRKHLIMSVAHYYVDGLHIEPKEVGKIFSKKLGTYNLKQKSIKNLTRELEAYLAKMFRIVIDHMDEETQEEPKDGEQ